MYYEPGKTPHGLPHDPPIEMVIPGNSKALLAGFEGSPDKATQETRSR